MKKGKSEVTVSTRRESNKKTGRSVMCQRILSVMAETEFPLTAREIAVELYNNGLVQYPTRASVQPRITEMLDIGLIEVAGKAFDHETQRNVAAYKLAEREDEK